MTAAILVLLAGLVASMTRGQVPARCDTPAVLTSQSAFIDCARAGTEKYRDRSAAIADGYRLIGSDFPAMGEHWIRISSLFDGRFDAARPEVLNYVIVQGRPHLLGVGYAVPLLDGETPPDGPAGRSAWHDHTRSIADETMLPHHHTGGNDAGGARLAMMHAWVWSSNPEGTFAADNWTLPFLRLGLEPDPTAPPAAAKALSLASGGSNYFMTSIAAVTGPRDATALTAAFQRAVITAEDIVRENNDRKLTGPRLQRLAHTWRELWVQVDASLSDADRERLSHLPIR